MAEQTQTEKLRDKINAICEAHDLMAGDGKLGEFIDKARLGESRINQILKALKEARLVFTDYSTDDEGNIIIQGLEEIEEG